MISRIFIQDPSNNYRKKKNRSLAFVPGGVVSTRPSGGNSYLDKKYSWGQANPRFERNPQAKRSNGWNAANNGKSRCTMDIYA